MTKTKHAVSGKGGALHRKTSKTTSSDSTSTSAKQLQFHPLANLFPLAEGTEFDALVADIKANGLNEPIVLYEEMILDGRNRYRACLAAGVEPEFDEYIEGDDPLICIADPAAYVVSANIRRRHLTAQQKRDLIAKLLMADPSVSDRQIGKQIKADNKTVAAVRSDLERREEIPHAEVRTDTKGRKQSARKKTLRKPSASKPKRQAKKKKKVERCELEAAQAHIDELEAAREHDTDLAEKLRMAQIKIVGLEGEIEDLKRENAELRKALEDAKTKEAAS